MIPRLVYDEVVTVTTKTSKKKYAVFFFPRQKKKKTSPDRRLHVNESISHESIQILNPNLTHNLTHNS